jgi:hypothetical protein
MPLRDFVISFEKEKVFIIHVIIKMHSKKKYYVRFIILDVIMDQIWIILNHITLKIMKRGKHRIAICNGMST